MCGICGIHGEYSEDILKKMSEVIEHRGPDDSGCFTDDAIGICNRRLSIIDLAGGHQPIHNEDCTIWVVFNGEIYNFHGLRSTLEKTSHRFYTNSDTEVIVHSYEEWELNCLKKFNGMFTIVLWDSKQKRLLTARDRTGIKPFYYTFVDGAFIFASEIKAILQDKRVKIYPDFDAIHQYLNVRYFPEEKTPFLNIKKLLPGHFIEIKGKKKRMGCYWTLQHVSKVSEYTEEYYIAQLERILQSALKRHMISDVPIGFYLSGGVDSSSVVYFAKKNTDSPLKTFCMGFGEDEDEFKDAQLVADDLGTDHYNLTISKSLLKDFPKMIWYADMPKRNLYPYYVAELARKYVKVILSGLGADELFAGYNWKYEYARQLDASHDVAKVKLSLKNPLCDVTNEEFTTLLRNLYAQGDRALIYTLIQSVDRLFPEEYHEIYGPSLKYEPDSLKKVYEKFFSTKQHLGEQIIHADFSVKMPDDFLLVDDATSMAHSLESRVPYLDNELVEFAFTLPYEMKVREGYGKYILKKALTPYLHINTVKKKKQGFGPNTYNSYVKEIRECAQQRLLDGNLVKNKVVNQKYVEKILRSDARPELTRKYILIWNLLALEVWWDIYLNRKEIDRAPNYTM